jgi:hypothetical protein
VAVAVAVAAVEAAVEAVGVVPAAAANRRNDIQEPPRMCERLWDRTKLRIRLQDRRRRRIYSALRYRRILLWPLVRRPLE